MCQHRAAMAPALSIVPAYNEEARIGDAVTATLAYLDRRASESELVVVDDAWRHVEQSKVSPVRDSARTANDPIRLSLRTAGQGGR